MNGYPAPDGVVEELERTVIALRERLQTYEHKSEVTLDQCLQALHPVDVHLRIAEGRYFVKALAIVAADLLAGSIHTMGKESYVGRPGIGHSGDRHDIPRATESHRKTDCCGHYPQQRQTGRSLFMLTIHQIAKKRFGMHLQVDA